LRLRHSRMDTRLRTDKKRRLQFADETERESAEKLQDFDSQLIKQADIILLMSMFPDDFLEVVKRAAFDYYEPRTVHESSLSYGPHAVVAAHLGKTQISADFIARASRYNLDFTPVDEYSNGLHLSAYAGAWQGLVEGLSGLDIGIGVSRPCAQVLLVNLLPKKALVAGNGAMNFIDNLVAILFPATLGVFIILWDPVWGILIDGLTFFCAAIYTAQLPNVGHHESEEEFSLREALNGITVVINNATLLLGFAATLVLNVLCFPIFLVIAPYAISHRFSEEMWGYCLAASGFGACVGSVITVLVSGHERLVGLAVICGLFLAGAMALLGLGTSAWMVIMSPTFVGIVEASWLTGWATAIQTLSPEKDLGKVVAVDTFVTSGVHPFIYLGSGVVGGIIGYSQTLTLTAVVSAVGILLIVLTAIMFMPRSARNDQVQ
jgi:hypothetical protein